MKKRLRRRRGRLDICEKGWTGLLSALAEMVDRDDADRHVQLPFTYSLQVRDARSTIGRYVLFSTASSGTDYREVRTVEGNKTSKL